MSLYYQDEQVTLHHGDCIEIMRDLDEQSIHAVLTDPPFSSGGRRENARSLRKSLTRSVKDDDWIRGDALSTAGFSYLMRLCALEWRRILVPGGHALAFIDWRMSGTLGAALETGDLRQHPTLVWDKTQFGMGAVFRNQHEFIQHFTAGTAREPQRRDVGNVLSCKPVRDGDHPTEKPEPLLRTLLSVIAGSGEVVLDPFAGSGSTLLAAQSLGLKSIGIEADERYCEVIARRMDQGALDFGGLT